MATSRHKAKLKTRDPSPKHFGSLEEAGLFWDTHDGADYEKDVVETECEVDIKRRTFVVPLDGDLCRRVRSIARKKGISSETLLNMWIQEKASRFLHWARKLSARPKRDISSGRSRELLRETMMRRRASGQQHSSATFSFPSCNSLISGGDVGELPRLLHRIILRGTTLGDAVPAASASA